MVWSYDEGADTKAHEAKHPRLAEQLAIFHGGDGEEEARRAAAKRQGHALREADTRVRQVNNGQPAEEGKEHLGGGVAVSQAAIAIPEKLEKPVGSEKGMPFVHIYVRCEDLPAHKGQPVTSMVVVYSKLLHEEEWTEIAKSDIVIKQRCPEFENRFKLAFCSEVVRMVRFEVFRVKNKDHSEYLSHQRFIGGYECRLIHLISARSHEGGWIVRELVGHSGASVGRLGVWAEEDHGGKSMVMFNLSASGLRYTDVWKHTTDAYFIIHRGENHLDDWRERCTNINPIQKGQQMWQSAASKEVANKRRPRLGRKRPTIGEERAFDGPTPEFAIWRSEVIRRQTSPKWKRVEGIQSQELCDGDMNRPILIEIWDWFRISAPRQIGMAETCFEDIYMQSWKQKPLSLQLSRNEIRCCRCCSSKGSPTVIASGTLNISRIIVDRRYTFLDFIRGGLEIVPLLAVDMTRGNLDPDNPKSLHGAPAHGKILNDYATALKAVCEIFQSYQGADAFPLYGFGAKIPPARSRCSHCFSLSGDFLLPHCLGIQGVLDAYHHSLQVVNFHGPTRFSELLHMAAKWAQPFLDLQKAEGHAALSQQKYFVLMIVTKGSLDDEQATVKALTKFIGLPLSISIIGVGSTGHGFLEGLGEEVKAWQQMSLQVSCRMGHVCEQVVQSTHNHKGIACNECGNNVSTCKTRWDCEDCSTSFCEKCGIWVAQRMAKQPVYRDMVSFTKFNDYANDPHGLAAAAFSAIPEQMLSYYKLADAKPRHLSHFETEQGFPVKRKDVAVPKGHDLQLHAGGHAKKPTDNRAVVELESGMTSSESVQHPPSSYLSEYARAEIAREFEEMKLMKGLCPTFLAERRVELQDAGEELGYLQEQVKLVLDDGIAEDSMDTLVEGIVYGHQGDMPSYKEATRHVREVAATRARKDAAKTATKRQRHITYEGFGTMHEELPHLEDSVVDVTPQHHALRRTTNAFSEKPSSEQLFVRSRSPLQGFAVPGLICDETKLDVIDLNDDVIGALCTICYERPINVELLPCHHKVACEKCISQSGALCPLCRKSVEEIELLPFARRPTKA